jgi:hypothetical protein
MRRSEDTHGKEGWGGYSRGGIGEYKSDRTIVTEEAERRGHEI